MKKTVIALLTMSIFACKIHKNEIPEFSFTTIDGKQIDKENLKGDATVVCVWATWCGDCIREIPELNQLVDKYKDNPRVNFIAMSDEDETTVRKSLKRFPFKFDHIVNAKDYTDKLKTGLTKHFPQVLVIDDKLNIVFDVTENKEEIFGVLDTHIINILK
ncbi:TlpA family protein disulfide reductase [Bacteroidia bacterium]|nr:TlpA family protein disulfide reductase [Bacteroidia bacterium]